MTGLTWGTLATPVGEVSVGCGEAGIARIRFGPPLPGAVTGRDSELLTGALRQLRAYFDGQLRAFDLPLDWSGLGGVRRHVLSLLWKTVGFGQTVTYGALAHSAGLTPGPAGEEGTAQVPPARVVGQIMGSNPFPIVVPCHRVLAGNGLGGYSGGGGIEIKRWLLIFEGAWPATLDWDPAGLVSGARW